MKGDKQIIIFLLLIAFIPRFVSLLTFDFIDSGGGSDSVTYVALARNLFSGHGYTEFGLPHTIHHPLYPILIGLIWQLTGNLVFSAQLISCLSGIILVIPVYLMASSMFNRRIGFTAALMTAIFPLLVYGSTEAFSESVYTLFLISGLTAGWYSFRSCLCCLPIFSGFFLGLGFLTHPLGITFLPLVVGFNLLMGVRRGNFFRKNVPWALLIILGFTLVCFPFWIHLRSVTGNWQISGSSHYQDFGLRYDQVRGVEESKIIYDHMESLFGPNQSSQFDQKRDRMGLTELIFRYPGRFLQIIRLNIIDGYKEAVKTAHYLAVPKILFMALLLLGLVIMVAYVFIVLILGRDRAAMLYMSLMFVPMAVFLVIIIEHRYFFPFIPLALIMLSHLLVNLWELCKNRLILKKILIILILVYFLVLTIGSGVIVCRKAVKAGIPYEYKIMGNWMKNNLPGIEKEKVMMFRLGVSYYAGCDWNVFYWGDFPGLKNYLKERGIKYLVIDDYKLHMIHPELRFLLDTKHLPSGFRLVREIHFDGRTIRLLEFQPMVE